MRSLKSARRLISLIAFVFWYIFAFIRPFDRGAQFPMSRGSFPFANPSSAVIEAIVFAIFSFLSLLLMMGVFNYRGQFRPADIDVLFATPVSPKLVLVFRIVRDYMFTLLLPLFLAIIFYRPFSAGFASFLAQNPNTAGYLGKASTVAWILIAMFWVCSGYAISLWVNRSDIRSERNRRIYGWGFATVVIFTVAYISFQVRGMQSPGDAVYLAQSPVLRSIFFTATAATEMVMGTLNGSLGITFLAGSLLASAVVVALMAAFAQVGWMYDQAASRGTDAQTSRSLQRQGDMIGLMAERARQGKLKAGRIGIVQRLRTKGIGALIWKEIIVLSRSSAASFALLVPVVFLTIILPTVAIAGASRGEKVAGPIFEVMTGFGVFMLAMSLSQAGFIEMLRRVDFQKPLPFSAAQIVFAEILAKVIPTAIVNWAAVLVTVAIRPTLWPEGIALLVTIPFAAMMMTAVVLLMTVLFPDVDDPTQRGFRGLMMMLGFVVTGGPCVGIYVLVASFGSPIPAALIASTLAIGFTAGLATVAGGLYAGYNPSE